LTIRPAIQPASAPTISQIIRASSDMIASP
jgi:hypothetical protein